MLLINYETKLMLTWPANCVICRADRATTFAISDIKLYVHLVSLSPLDNTKLLEQLKSGYKRPVNWKKYQSRVPAYSKNKYLDNLIDWRFERVNILLSDFFMMIHSE